MPFIPHTAEDVSRMLERIGVADIEALFDEIPEHLRVAGADERIPAGLDEAGITRLMHRQAADTAMDTCFMGAGAYEHHVPAAVWQIATRGEFYSAYTPYQAEASQGSLQLIYEYQTMMASLTGLDVSNASMYDGASALGEAVLMAVRANRKSRSKRILIPASVHPVYRHVARVIVGNQGIEFVELPVDRATGTTDLAALDRWRDEDVTAVIVPQPNYFGALEDVDALVDAAHAMGALAIGVVNPVAMAVLRPPGEWGAQGADIACGDGQPLGIPLSGGGPYYGFMCCRQGLVRQLPGRLVGRASDSEGREGFTLTLQPREQHIRRSRATSNICTNQGLMVTASTIHMALLGADGLADVARTSHARTRELVAALTALPGVTRAFDGPFFHEALLQLDRPAAPVLAALAEAGILGGVEAAPDYPELDNTLLVCATEMRDSQDIQDYARKLGEIMQASAA